MGQHLWDENNETPETEPEPVEDVGSGDVGKDNEDTPVAPTEG